MNSISVVMPIKNRFELAKIALLSVVNQTLKPNQVVLVDDGSDVRVLEVLATEISFARSQGIIVDVLENNISNGVSASRNMAIKYATGQFIAFCDSDDYWIPHKLEFVMSLVEKYRANIVVHSFVWIVGKHWFFKLLIDGAVFFVPRALLALIFFLHVSACVISKACIMDGFKAGLSFHEDLDFFLKISEKTKLLFVNYPCVYMGRSPGSAGGLTENRIKMIEGAINVLENAKGIGLFRLCIRAKLVYLRLKYFLICRNIDHILE
ncbi:MAG: glycosyltransferase family 2 protein [Saprospiraceae bacterium]|nr:glycosyltransferase family 2 protein [Saprospiraceae bacterium]